MNTNYGKLNDGVIEYAPDKLETKYGTIDHPNEQNYLFYGWKKIIEGSGFGDFGYYQTTTEIIKIHATTSYGKMTEATEEAASTIEFAPEVLVNGTEVVENPTAEQYLAAGYKACVDANGASKFLTNDTTIYGVWTNSAYGKLAEDGTVVYADDKLSIDGEIVLEPTEAQFNTAGFYEIVDNPLPEQEGYTVEEDGWEIADNKLNKKYKYVKLPDPVYEYSKLKILVQIKQLGYWDQVKAWIESANLWDEYLACQVFSSDNEYFKQGLEAIKQAIPELTDEVINQVLQNSIIDASELAALNIATTEA